MGIEPPIPISMKLGDSNNVFRRIVAAAQQPHLSVPETEAGRNRKHYKQLVNRSLMFASGMHFDFSFLFLVLDMDAVSCICVINMGAD